MGTVEQPVATKFRKVVAAVEIVGGAMGAVLFLRHAVRVMRVQPNIWLAVPLPLAAFGFCVLAGTLLWLDRPRGRVLTLIALAPQVPSVWTATLGYTFNVGIGLRMLVASHRVSWFPFWGSELHVTVHEAAGKPTLGINLVALAFIVLVWKARPIARSIRDAAYET